MGRSSSIKKFSSLTDNESYHGEHNDLYYYCVYIGKASLIVDPMDSVWYVQDGFVASHRGGEVHSTQMAVVIRGYTPSKRIAEINTCPYLPYINGCATSQLLPPIRIGDPTFQLLSMPPYTSEQSHHIHSTARVVFVYEGSGTCEHGSEGHTKSMKLEKGDVLIIDKMYPHHFVTEKENLVVLPLHIFSSTSLENSHPMMEGTHKTQG